MFVQPGSVRSPVDWCRNKISVLHPLSSPGLVMVEDDNTLFRKKLRLWKNNLGVCVSFMLLFLGFMGLTSLQSSLHRDGGLGVINQAVLYTTLVLSCMFLPPIVISKLGWKWSLAISETGYVLWMAANMYATWGTMIPASIIVGTTASLVWAAQSSYTTECGVRMAALTGERPDDVISKFFGVFIMFFQSCKYLINSEVRLTPSVLSCYQTIEK